MHHGTVVLPLDAAPSVLIQLAGSESLLQYEDATPHLTAKVFK